MTCLPALGWGALAASSLVLGAVLAVLRSWRDGVVGVVLAFGAGALISSVAFELAQKGIELAGTVPVAIGLALGAGAFFLANRAVDRLGSKLGGGAGLPLALGALLDGIPEQAVLGMAWLKARASASPCWQPSSSPTCPRASAREPTC